jgi:3-isopropylmalate/(R)-2-methylmalate dehydratase large subunit
MSAPTDIAGRVLYLSAVPGRIEAQLQGRRLGLREAAPLRDEISTDEITPIPILGCFDAGLGRFPYTGLEVDGARPIEAGAILACGCIAVAAGRRYGKGSSREHSPLAEFSAGIRLVVAESFERIYRQNADNIGLFTSTDFGLLEALERGETLPLEALLAGRDPLARAVLAAGGLLHYGQQHLKGARPLAPANQAGNGPQTFFEKIIARHALHTPANASMPAPGDGGFLRADWRFIHEYYTGMCAHLLDSRLGGEVALKDPDGILAFEDHLGHLHQSEVHRRQGLTAGLQGLVRAHRDFVARFGVRAHGALAQEGSEGIAHAMMAERYMLPGQVAVGTDSHTTHCGALGGVAFGVGTTDMANAMVTGAVRFTMPESLRIVLSGTLGAGVSAKDVALHLLADARIRAGVCVGKALEFGGPVIAGLSTDERATLTNMTAELGGFTGLVVPDDETVRFLRERRGVELTLQPWMRSDAGARYAMTLEFDCSAMAPMVARPGDPGHGVPLPSLETRPRIDIAYGGSCTAGKRDDFDRYHEVLAWAVGRGLGVAPGVALFLQFGTTDVRDYCERQGYLETFRRAGARLLQPSCGACANCGPGASTEASQVTISAINRNFPGRSGPGQVWLASPATVAASAVVGTLASFDELRAAPPAAPPSPTLPILAIASETIE